MVGTRSQKIENLKMERARLEAMTLEELRLEAACYQLQSTIEPSRLIDAILDHIEQSTSARELPPTGQRSRTTSVRPQTAPGQFGMTEQSELLLVRWTARSKR